MVQAVTFLAVFIPCWSYAMWRGAAPERWAAGLQLAALILSAIELPPFLPGDFSTVLAWPLLVDLILAIALTIVAFRADRLWPLPVAACQWVAVTVHVAKLIFPSMPAFGYAFLYGLWAYPMILLTAIGAWRCQRRRRRRQPNRSWRT
ncbi:MAG: hypothetical protein ACTHM8_03065 [Sphingomonas sp.]